MSDYNPAQARQLLESMARTIADAANMADQLGLEAAATILREAEDAAKRRAEGHQDPDWHFMLR